MADVKARDSEAGCVAITVENVRIEEKEKKSGEQ